MKNFIFVMIILIVMLSVFPATIHADEVSVAVNTTIDETEKPTTDMVTDITDVLEETPEETTPEETSAVKENTPKDPVVTEPTETPTEGDENEVVSFIDRIAEAWENGDINLVISLAFDVAIIIFAYLAKKSSKKNTLEVAGIFGENGAYSVKQTKTIEAINNLVDAANEATNAVAGDGGLKSIVEEFQSNLQEEVQSIKELDKEKLNEYGNQLAVCIASVKCLAEMLQTVYANSTTIPMPVKNMINEKYVEICKNLNNDNGGASNA